MVAGPSGINPQQQLASQIDAAQQFANVNVTKKEATGKQKELTKPLDLEDKPELSTLAEKAQDDPGLDLVESTLLSQQQETQQAEQEGFQTGQIGAHGKRATQQKEDTHQEQGGKDFADSKQVDFKGASQSSRELPNSQEGSSGIEHEGKGGKIRHTNQTMSQQEAESLADVSGDAAAGEKALQRSKLKRKTQVGTDIQESSWTDWEEEVDAEKEIEGAFVASVSGPPPLHPAMKVAEANIEPQKISATYYFGTEPAVYTPPVHEASVEQIFAPQNPKAPQALDMVRGIELSPLSLHTVPWLEPKGKYKPIAVFQDGGILSGDLELSSESS
jgi:hypothetical protein